MHQLPVNSGLKGYDEALGSLARAKNLWSLLIILALLVHLAGFVLVEFFDAGAPSPAGPTTAASRPANPTEAGAKADAKLTGHVATVVGAAMRISRLIAPIAAGLLAVVALLAVLVALTGRLDGIAALVGAFLWSAVLAVVLVPWESLAPATRAVGALGARALSDLRQDKPPTACGVTSAERLLFYARYAAYPVLAMLMWLVVQARFAAGRRRAARGSVAVERHEG